MENNCVAHYWIIDSKNYGICKFCGVEKQMLGWYEYLDFIEGKNRRMGGNSYAEKRAQKPKNTGTAIVAMCANCGKERWVIPVNGKARHPYCRSCAQVMRKDDGRKHARFALNKVKC